MLSFTSPEAASRTRGEVGFGVNPVSLDRVPLGSDPGSFSWHAISSNHLTSRRILAYETKIINKKDRTRLLFDT